LDAAYPSGSCGACACTSSPSTWHTHCGTPHREIVRGGTIPSPPSCAPLATPLHPNACISPPESRARALFAAIRFNFLPWRHTGAPADRPACWTWAPAARRRSPAQTSMHRRTAPPHFCPSRPQLTPPSNSRSSVAGPCKVPYPLWRQLKLLKPRPPFHRVSGSPTLLLPLQHGFAPFPGRQQPQRHPHPDREQWVKVKVVTL